MKEESYSAFLAPPERPDATAPDDLGDECSLCEAAGPLRWYVVEQPTNKKGHSLEAPVLAQRWAVCPDCHQLVSDSSRSDA